MSTGQGRRRTRLRSAMTLLAAGVVLTLGAAGLSGCSAQADAFVTRSGTSFQVDGAPFRFVGFTLYDAAASDIYSCAPGSRLTDAELADAMRYVHDRAGGTVVRFWAYQTYTAGGTDFSGMDLVIAAARKAGLRVLPVLEDGPGDCSTGQTGVAKAAVEGDTWYQQGYKRPYGDARLSYRDYVRVVAAHYRDDPNIAAWMLMNEAETGARNVGDHTALADFALDVATVVKAVDRHHLVTLGTQANGAPGTSGRDFADIYRQPVLDFTEVHDWARYGSDTEALPGSVEGQVPAASSPQCQSTTAPIACSFAIARELGKPLVVGEAGITATDAASRARRAGLLHAKMDAAFGAGASGYLVWQLSNGTSDGYGVVPDGRDPLGPVMAGVARRLRD